MTATLGTLIIVGVSSFLMGGGVSALLHAREVAGYKYVLDHLVTNLVKIKTEVAAHVSEFEALVLKDEALLKADVSLALAKIKAAL